MRTHRGVFWALLFVALLPASGVAAAETSVAAAYRPTYAFGTRIGGYGFRERTAAAHNPWTDCRMNGLGVFAERAFGRVAYVEAGLDLYFAETWPFKPAPGETDMDRISGLVSVAGGLRMFGGSLISPHVQLGLGMEVTRVSMTHDELPGASGTFVLPVGFISIGGDIRLGRHLSAGLDLRALVMGDFDHDAEKGDDLAAKPSLAAQLQFYAKYRL